MKKLFIVHGWTYSLDKWAPFIESLKASGYDPIQLKVPGLTEPSEKSWDIESYVAWLDAKLKSENKPIVIGHSNGGRIALAYAQAHPGKIGQLILIDSAGIPINEAVAKAKLKTLKVISKIGKPLAYIPIVKKVFYKVIGAQDFYNAPPNMKVTMQNMLAADKNIDLSKINLPLTIIWGRDDAITPLSDGQKINAAIKDSELFVIDEARHSPFYTKPDEVTRIISEQVKS